MSAFQIGGSPFRPMSDVTASKKPKAKETAQNDAPPKGAFDTVSVSHNRLAAMPRMGSVSGNTAQHVQGGTVESMLRDSAAELDDYFSKAYGFE